MATNTTLGRNASLIGIKTQLEAAGVRSVPSLCFLAGTTLLLRQDSSALSTPSNGGMTVSLISAVTGATGTVTTAELRDRSDAPIRIFTVGGTGSGRDLEFSIVPGSGSGAAINGNGDLVFSEIGAGINAWILNILQPA